MIRNISTGLLAMAVITGLAAAAGAVDSKAGTTAGEFLRLGAGARAAAMGEAFAASADGASSLYWNPAGLAGTRGREAMLAHTQWYMDVNHEYAAYAQPLPAGWGAAGISATYLMTTFEKRAGDTEAADANGSIGDMAVAVSYGRALAGGIDGGITAKYISSKIDAYSSTGFAFDLGLRKTLGRLTAGLAVRNLGGSLKYAGDAVAVGSTADLGLAFTGAGLKGLTVAADYDTLLNGGSSSVNAGVEYAWNAGGDFALMPRAGFRSGGSRISAGLGFRWKGYRLDYAFVPHADLGTANRLSLSVSF